MLFQTKVCVVALLSSLRIARTQALPHASLPGSSYTSTACSFAAFQDEIFFVDSARCPSFHSKLQFSQQRFKMGNSNGAGAPKIDVLTASATYLQEKLTAGKITSVALVELYLQQIEKYNHRGIKLNAMLTTAPTDLLMQRAKLLDDERAAGKIRSPLHGIPISVKVFAHGISLYISFLT
jgi:hypothetical protein